MYRHNIGFKISFKILLYVATRGAARLSSTVTESHDQAVRNPSIADSVKVTDVQTEGIKKGQVCSNPFPVTAPARIFASGCGVSR